MAFVMLPSRQYPNGLVKFKIVRFEGGAFKVREVSSRGGAKTRGPWEERSTEEIAALLAGHDFALPRGWREKLNGGHGE